MYDKLKEDVKQANDLANNPELKISSSTKIKYKANFFVQLRWLLWRSMLSTFRDPISSYVALAQTIVIALLFGLIYLRLNYDQSGVQNLNGVLFLLLTNTSFSNMFAVLNVILFFSFDKKKINQFINDFISIAISGRDTDFLARAHKWNVHGYHLLSVKIFD